MLARADWPVIDVSNLAQNVITAARTLEAVNNQITQIQQFVQMLEYEGYAQTLAYTTPEHKEGVKAFREKRAPMFRASES